MTAGAARLEREPSIRLVRSDDAPGIGSSVRNGVRSFFGKITGFFSNAWNWLRRTLHLDAIGERIAGGYRWVRMQGNKVVGLLQADGLIGLGLLAGSTTVGRQAVGFVLKPIGWVLDLAAKVYTWVERALANKTKGGIRNWISDRMRSVREFFFGEPALTLAGAKSAKTERKIGLVNSVVLWFAQTFSSLLDTDGVPMRLARSIGAFLFGRRSLVLLGMLPLGAFMTPAMVVGTGLLIWATAAAWEPELTDTWNKFRGHAATAGHQAAALVDATEEDLKQDVQDAGDVLASDRDGIPKSVNRSTRRGHPAGKTSVRRST